MDIKRISQSSLLSMQECEDGPIVQIIFGGGGFVVCQYEPKYFNLFSTPVIDATRYSLLTKILFEFICTILCKCNLYYVMSCFFYILKKLEE